MKIARIRVFAHDLNVMNGPYVFSGGSLEALTTYLVAVETDTGVTGWGETCPLGPTYQPAHAKGAAAALVELAPNLVGVAALPNVAGRVMERCLNGHNYAKAAIDIALWDVMGKVAGLPVHALLGGALVDRVPSYYAINLASAEDTVAAVKAKQAEGFTRFQIKTGSGDVMQDAAVLRAAWEQMRPGDVMAADANRALTTADTLHLSRLLWDIPLALEQPCASLDQMRALKGRVHHPVFLDEMAIDVNTLISEMGGGLCDGLGMKVTRIGGISAMRAVRDMAVARRMPLSVDDSWGADIIAAACVHIGATVPQDIYRGTWIAAPYIDHHYDPSGGVFVEDGHIAVPHGPGLGISPDESLFGDPVLEIAT